MTHVVLVESPSKVQSISQYLGKDYKVLATYGHIRDLLSKDGAVDVQQDFAMTWVVSDKAKKTLNSIASALKTAKSLWLATDPDREGEAISWHVVAWLRENGKISDNLPIQRITFNAITRQAVQNSLRHPRPLDSHLIDAYLARRALDFLVGFSWSPILWRKLKGSRSAGRVQSVALRLIVDKEDSIQAFQAQDYWTIEGVFGDPQFPATLVEYKGTTLEKLDISTQEQAQSMLDHLLKQDYILKSVQKKRVSREPPPPFTTSTLQQSAWGILKISPTQTMRYAQSLYEKGLITYMRTDSPTLSPEGLKMLCDAVHKRFGDSYALSKPRQFSGKAKNAQEAHEAIRPTQAQQEKPEGLTESEFDLYHLIWRRSLASQIQPAVDEHVTALIHDQNQSQFKATGTTEIFDGYRRVWNTGSKDTTILPPLKSDQSLSVHNIEACAHTTQPPSRYSAASLIKKMEDVGIGRPSTYAQILHILMDRNYVRQEKRVLIPEERGTLVTKFLQNAFETQMDYQFTADLEKTLDRIASGQSRWKEVLHHFWSPFFQKVQDSQGMETQAVMDMLHQQVLKETKPCPKCQSGTLQLKMGKHSAFLGCSSYPECSHTESTSASTDVAPSFEPKSVATFQDQEVLLKKGPYGFYLQVGEGKKPKRASIPRFLSIDDLAAHHIDLLLSLPKVLGHHQDHEVLLCLGPYGPYVSWQTVKAPIRPAEGFFTLSLADAIDAIEKKKAKPPSTRRRKKA